MKDAIARNVFAARLQARNPRDAGRWSAQTERLLVRSALDALAIAGKSGLVAAGFAKAEAAIARDRVVGLMHASDAGADGVAKLAGALRRRRRRRRDRGHQGVSRRPNWIWHWGGQMWYMQPCLPGLQMTRFWRVLRALSAFATGETGQGGAGRDRN